jgi:predicted TPR repeat methyltransferase
MHDRRGVLRGADYFEALYEANADPWRVETSGYETAKYDASLAALPHARYASALDVGCTVGVFTRLLAGRCDRVLGLDVSDRAVAAARERCRDLASVSIERMAVPHQWPAGRFDLVVLSEILYYLPDGDLAALAERIGGALTPGGTVLLVHWTGAAAGDSAGDLAVNLFATAAAGFARSIRHQRTAEYRIDVLAVPP